MNVGAVVASGAMWAAIPVALLAGLVSFVSPCVLPLIPGYLGFIGGAVGGPSTSSGTQVGQSVAEPVEAPARRRLLGGVLLFIAGFTLVFVAVIVLGGLAGGALARWNEIWGDVVIRVLGVCIIALGFVFIGFIGRAQRTVKLQVPAGLGLVGAPLLGIALGLGWTPCIGPTLGAIMSVAWFVGDPVRAAVLGIAYSLGLGIPFLLVALGFGWVARSTAFLRRHIRAVNIIGGVLLIVLGALMALGLWSAAMTHLGRVFGGIEAPL
ncbi:MAG: cytochrome c biogenesis protein CcdA [Microbacterium sp.]